MVWQFDGYVAKGYALQHNVAQTHEMIKGICCTDISNSFIPWNMFSASDDIYSDRIIDSLTRLLCMSKVMITCCDLSDFSACTLVNEDLNVICLFEFCFHIWRRIRLHVVVMRQGMRELGKPHSFNSHSHSQVLVIYIPAVHLCYSPAFEGSYMSNFVMYGHNTNYSIPFEREAKESKEDNGRYQRRYRGSMKATSGEGTGHNKCSCGEHCGCNPCTCPRSVVTTGVGKAYCKCGADCACPTCSS
ncbi:hypothetical protein Peur_014885 [Populus x canadensis]